MHNDRELEWMASLDWSMHGPIRDDFISRRVVLSAAAELFGQQVCAPWPEVPFLISHAGIPPMGPVVPADEAFDQAGEPIQRVHDRLSGLMRSHAEWLNLRLGDPERITTIEWNDILENGAWEWSAGEGARRAAAGLAPLIARAVAEGSIRAWARPKGGGDDRALEIEPSKWEVDPDVAVRRLASCGLCWDQPYEPEAPLDHFIFIDRVGLQNAIVSTARVSYVPISFIEHRLQRRADHTAVNVDEAASHLRTLMTPDNLHWTNDEFERALTDKLGPGARGRIYERARRIVVADPKHSVFARPGRKSSASMATGAIAAFSPRKRPIPSD